MAVNKNILNGARAIISIDNEPVAIFESCTYSTSLRTEAAYILGRFTAAAIVPTSMEVVNLNCSGFRVYNEGPHTKPKFPTLQSLLLIKGVTISIVDRANPSVALLTATDCYAISYSGGFSAQATSKVSVVYQGISITDENSVGDAEVGASSLPQ